MHTNMRLLTATLGGLALVQAQGAPPPQLLTTTKSGVLPVLPTETPFTGIPTNEGAIISPGPPRPGFVGPGGTATVQSNQPAATYRADFPPTMFNPLVGSTVRGYIMAESVPEGVRFTFNFTSLPSQPQYGPFGYHIHDLPVPESGNCTETMGHLDPTNRGELYMCDPSAPETCQVGDLAGKHGGKIMSAGSWTNNYTDAFLSTDPSSPAFFGSRSFVLHTTNATRITCANFVRVTDGGAGTNTSTPTPTSSPPPSYTGLAAGRASVFSGAAGLVAAGFAFLIL